MGKTRKITNNNLKLAGLVLGWLVLEYVGGDLTFKHIGRFWDKKSAVYWSYKGRNSTSIPASQLLRFLALRQYDHKSSSLTPMIIVGGNNEIVDITLRAFNNGKFVAAQKT